MITILSFGQKLFGLIRRCRAGEFGEAVEPGPQSVISRTYRRSLQSFELKPNGFEIVERRTKIHPGLSRVESGNQT